MIHFSIGGFLWKRTFPQRAHEIDLDTGRKSWLTVEEMAAVRDLFVFRFVCLEKLKLFLFQWRAERRSAPLYIRIFRILFSN